MSNSLELDGVRRTVLRTIVLLKTKLQCPAISYGKLIPNKINKYGLAHQILGHWAVGWYAISELQFRMVAKHAMSASQLIMSRRIIEGAENIMYITC